MAFRWQVAQRRDTVSAMPTTRAETVPYDDGTSSSDTVFIPDGGGGPGLLLLQEIFGVNDYVRAKASDLAALGYVVLCPDVFHRIEPGVAIEPGEEALEKGFAVSQRYFGEIDEGRRLSDLQASLQHLRRLPEAQGPVGVIGYCFGGTLSYQLAAGGGVDACVSYYGSGVAGLLERGQRLSCPALFHFGGADPFLPFEQVAQIIVAYNNQDNTEVLVQPGVGHAFENHLNPMFSHPVAAARSWPVTVEFLRANLQR